MKRFQSIVIAAVVVVMSAVALLPAHNTAAQSSAALSITPKKNYTIEPGKSVNDGLTIRNLDLDQPLVLGLRVIDFTFTDDGGSPKLMLAEDAPQTTWSLKPYLTLPQSVTVEPGSSVTVDMSVAIPANLGAGSYYSAVMYAAGAADGGNVGLSASGVTLVFASVPGTVNEKLTLESLGAYHRATSNSQAGYAFITEKEPQTIAYTLKNEGNVTQAPVGSITLKHMFGPEQVIDNVNPSSSLALIGQTRTFISCIKLKSSEVDFNGTRSEAADCAAPGLWPGLYTVNLDLFYGQNGNNTREVTGVAHFWYLPWWFVIAFIIVLAIVAYFVWRIVSFFRNRGGRGSSGRKQQRLHVKRRRR
jgi:hypothetical protein